MRFRFCLLAGLAAAALSAFAQSSTMTSSSTSSTGDGVRGTMRFSGQRFAGPTVTGAPYSAERITEHVQVAADGTRFTTTNQQETIYRDSQGRTRTERAMMMGPNNAVDAPMLIEISDPAAGVAYTLDAQNKVAHRTAFSARPQAGMGGGRGGSFSATLPPPSAAQPQLQVQQGIISMTAAPTGAVGAMGPRGSRPEVRQENLGSQLIEGVLADGQRFVQRWPAGSQGSDRPFETVSETWMSPELKLAVLNKSVDPRSGENTTKLIHINRAEPAATLFEPPPDYKIVDETGGFEIQWTGSRRQN
jgi:hypothetical protein